MAFKSATRGLSRALHGCKFNPLLPPVCAGEQSRHAASDSATVASVNGDNNRGVTAHDRVVGEVSVGVVARGRAVGTDEAGS